MEMLVNMDYDDFENNKLEEWKTKASEALKLKSKLLRSSTWTIKCWLNKKLCAYYWLFVVTFPIYQ